MPFAIAVLSHPLGGYCLLIVAIAGGVYAAYVPGALVAAFVGTAAALLALLVYLATPPDAAGIATVVLGVVLINVEFRVPTYGAAGAAGIAAATLGSWWLLEPAATLSLGAAPRFAVALGGALVLLAAVGRALRRHTLPP